MTEPSTLWLDNERDQASAAQRARIENTKLLATFSTAMSATVVATALQVSPPSALDKIAAWLLVVAALGVVLVILLDRTREVDTGAILRNARIEKWNESTLMNELRQAAYATLTYNGSVVIHTRTAALGTAAAAFSAGVLSALSLLQIAA